MCCSTAKALDDAPLVITDKESGRPTADRARFVVDRAAKTSATAAVLRAVIKYIISYVFRTAFA